MSVIDLKLSAIYRASHGSIPLASDGFTEAAQMITDAIDPLVTNVGLAGNPAIGPDLSDLGGELFHHLSSMVRTLNDSAIGLDRIADNFVESDAEAKRWMEQNPIYRGEPPLFTPPTAPKV